MSTAVLGVRHAGALVTVQDGGRPGLLRFGVPASGPMDPVAHAVANLAVGRPATAAALEVSLGGLTVTCLAGPLTVAVCGGGFAVRHDGHRGAPWGVCTLHPGEELAVSAGTWGSWCYLAVAGALETPQWLGSAATHVRAGLGGGVVETGAELVVADAAADPARDGPVEVPTGAQPTGDLRVVLGPQQEWFDPGAVDALLGAPFTLTAAYDRMGVRLAGPPLPLRDALAIPSTPIVAGSVQVAGDGGATLLFADHQTTGGYPKIATVISPDRSGAAQLRAGDHVRFHAVPPAAAIRAARAAAAQRERCLDAAARRPGLLTRSLLGTNLISGVYAAHDRNDG